MAHKKAGGSTNNGRNSPGQRLGVKRFWWPIGQRQGRLLCASWAQNFTPVEVLVWVRTTQSLL